MLAAFTILVISPGFLRDPLCKLVGKYFPIVIHKMKEIAFGATVTKLFNVCELRQSFLLG